MKRRHVIAMILVIVSVFSATGISSVSAQELSAKTFTTCPTFDALETAILTDRIIYFDLAKDCKVSFKEDIAITSYAIIHNVGTGRLTFDGNGSDGDSTNDTNFFSVSGGGLEMYNLTLTNGRSLVGGAITIYSANVKLDHITFRTNQASAQGGAIYFAAGDLDIRDSYFYANTTTEDPTGSTGAGGAIYASNFGQTSRLFILNSTFEQNRTGDSAFGDSGRGGAIYVYDVQGALLVNIFNSTFYNNTTGSSVSGTVGDGGAIYANDYDGAASLNIYHSTFSRNGTGTTMSGVPGDGQTIYLRDSILNIAGTILANSRNSYGGSGEDCDFRGTVSVHDGGFNIIENMGDCRAYLTRSTEKDPGLADVLTNNGGDTKTIALTNSSPAVDQIPFGTTSQGINLCGYDYADFDQRGEARPGNEWCDIGAYEIIDENHPHVLPSTGFPQGQMTLLPQPQFDYRPLADESGGMQLVIPAIGVNAAIVGVPLESDQWNVDWLGSSIGYLQGTAFPTWLGNSVLTGHATNSLGQPGVLANLGNLKYNDTITIQAWGQAYVFAVRERYQTSADDLSILRHSEMTQLTLITCTGYDVQTMTYPLREVVVAVLIAVR